MKTFMLFIVSYKQNNNLRYLSKLYVEHTFLDDLLVHLINYHFKLDELSFNIAIILKCNQFKIYGKLLILDL